MIPFGLIVGGFGLKVLIDYAQRYGLVGSASTGTTVFGIFVVRSNRCVCISRGGDCYLRSFVCFIYFPSNLDGNFKRDHDNNCSLGGASLVESFWVVL